MRARSMAMRSIRAGVASVPTAISPAGNDKKLLRVSIAVYFSL